MAFSNLWESVRVEQVTDLVGHLSSPHCTSSEHMYAWSCLVMHLLGARPCSGRHPSACLTPVPSASVLNRMAVLACFAPSNVVSSYQAVLQRLERYMATKKSEFIGLGIRIQGQTEV